MSDLPADANGVTLYLGDRVRWYNRTRTIANFWTDSYGRHWLRLEEDGGLIACWDVVFVSRPPVAS